MLAFSNDYYGMIFRATQSVELFCAYDHPAYLLRNSLVSASLLAGIWNAKYINAVPLYRQEQEFQRMGVNIDRADMARWTILCAERYLSIFYDYLHEKLYEYHVLQADELCEALHNSSAIRYLRIRN